MSVKFLKRLYERAIYRSALASIILACLIAPVASALSTDYFDDTHDASPSATTVLVSGSTRFVEKGEVHVIAYFSQSTGSITIQGADFCKGAKDKWDQAQSGDSLGDEVLNGKLSDKTQITQYKVNGNVVYTGLYRSSSSGYDANCGSGSHKVSITGAAYDANLGMYYVNFDAGPLPKEAEGLQNGFRLQLGTNGEYIAQAGTDTGYGVTIQEVGKAPEYRQYDLKFGTDCSLTKDTTENLTFYDLDNIGSSNPNDAQYGKRIGLLLYQFDGSGDPTGTLILSITPDDKGSTGSSGTTNIPFTAKPGERYLARLTDVYYNNTIQFSTPFSGIYFEKPCNAQTWSVSGKTTISTSAYVAPGTTVNWTHALTKTGIADPTVSYAIQRSDVPIGSNTNFSTVPTKSGSWNTSSAFAPASGTDSYTVTSADVGHRICERIFWTPANYDDSTKSPPSGNSTDNGTMGDYCVNVYTLPIVHILGNDLRVGSDFINTNNNLVSTVTGTLSAQAASLAEYGILAAGTVKNIASQYGLASPTDQLTFANTGVGTECSTGQGCYAGSADMGLIPDNTGFFSSATENGQAIEHDFGGGAVNQGTIAGITGGSTSSIAGTYVISTKGDITISNDITYTGGALNSLAAIPQLILIGNNINIAGNVKHVDAWLIASGTINTCSDVASADQLNLKTCNQQLTVNGPVMAKKLLLYRTYYNMANANDPAETINMRADAYIVSNRLSQGNGSWQTVYTTELPPRY